MLLFVFLTALAVCFTVHSTYSIEGGLWIMLMLFAVLMVLARVAGEHV
jgi:hypothetical protein